MDNFRIPHQLDGHGPPRLGDVIIPHRVGVALNRNDQEPVNPANVCQPAGNLLRLSNVERDAADIRTDFGSD